MLCDVCFRMLRGQDGRVWKGTYDLHFKHHLDQRSLRRSADMNCGICRVLHEEWQSMLEATLGASASDTKKEIATDSATYRKSRSNSPGVRTPTAEWKGPQFNISAILSVLDHPRVKDLYRLDFKMRHDRTRRKRTFILQKNDSSDPLFRTQLSHNTSSDEVYTLVLNWMARCTRECKADCKYIGQKPPRWYPARLISLRQLKKADLFNVQAQDKSVQAPDVKVSLVETEQWPFQRPPDNIRYVTLSHCWGQGVTSQHKLTSRNIDRMKEGIRLSDLPKTFQDAITFAARLPQVGYIWIDSLCIKQGPEEQDDWLKQSASMDRIYSETFLNLSATHAHDSQGGLFRYRTPELLLEDEVTLNIEGLPGGHPPPPNPPPFETVVRAADSSVPSTGRKLIRFLGTFLFIRSIFVSLRLLLDKMGDFLELDSIPRTQVANRKIVGAPPNLMHGAVPNAIKRSGTKLGAVNALKRSGLATEHGTFSRPRTNLSEDSDTTSPKAEAERYNLKRCTILDASFWFNRVDNAPVNRRGWVLQERLMSPRVLHFCHDQVAWECCGFDAAEGQPEGMPNFQLTSGGIIEESRLKGLDVTEDGARLRNIRLNGYKEPDVHLKPQLYALELWRRIVEVYTKTAITNPEDKLIALSGMAKLMAAKIGSSQSPAEYAAGLWKLNLASQLLWQVEPVWREVDERFENVSTSPTTYRAPSWSWASVDAYRGHGITYGDITDQDLYIEVSRVFVAPLTKTNPFGIVDSKGTYIDLWGKLRKAILYCKPKGRFGWRLVDRGHQLDSEEHTNIYLDSPADGVHNNMFGDIHDTSRVYVMPAAKGPRVANEESKYLTCMIVQHQPGHNAGRAVFRRIGVTKLSPWADSKALKRKNVRSDFKILEFMQSDVDVPYEEYDADRGRHMIRLI